MKILVLTAFHKRPEISEIYWQNMVDLGLDVVAIVSDNANKLLANKYAYKVIEHRNEPLGEKLQYGADYLKELDFDYILFLGSDDLISHKLIEQYKQMIDNGDEYIGVLDYLDMNIHTKKFRYFEGYTNHRKGESLGAGRIISKRLLEQIDYKCFPTDRHRYMDNAMTYNLLNIGVTNKLVKKMFNPYLIGIKNNVAISNIIKDCPYAFRIPLDGYFSDKVIEMLNK